MGLRVSRAIRAGESQEAFTVPIGQVEIISSILRSLDIELAGRRRVCVSIREGTFTPGFLEKTYEPLLRTMRRSLVEVQTSITQTDRGAHEGRA